MMNFNVKRKSAQVDVEMDLILGRIAVRRAKERVERANRERCGQGEALSDYVRARRELGQKIRNAERFLGREPRYRENGMKRLGV